MKMKNFDPGSSIISFDMQAFLGFVDSDDERDAIPGTVLHRFCSCKSNAWLYSLCLCSGSGRIEYTSSSPPELSR
jgi:hypothetical protein